MSSSLTVESLAEMFPGYSINIIRDVAVQCDNNHELALEKLLELHSEPSPRGPSLPPPPAALQTREAVRSALFPAKKGPPKPPGTGTLDPLLLDMLPHLAPASAAPCAPPLPPGAAEGEFSCEDICPGLKFLDTGQRDAGTSGSQAAAPPSGPAPASRDWWPAWPLSPAAPAGQPPTAGHSADAGACTHVGNGTPPPNGQLPMPSTWLLPPDAASDSLSATVFPLNGWDQPLEDTAASAPSPTCATPPRNLAGAPLSADASPHPGAAPREQRASSEASDDEALLELMPHLAHCLASPSPSGACSPAAGPSAPPAPASGSGSTRFASRQASEGFGAAELVEAVEFYLMMFPNLKREVVGDVLERYSDAPQAGLDQLIMLSACVENASGEADSVVPDQAGWDSPSSGSGSDEEDATGVGGQPRRGGAGTAGKSWERGLTPEELAGIERGDFPGLQRPQLPEPVVLAGPAGRPVSPEGQDELSAREKEELLKAEFAGIAAEEVCAALAVCDGSLFDAAELLRSFAAEDAGRSSNAQQSVAAAAASVPAAAASAPAEPGAGEGGVPQHAAPKVRHLARRFPGVAAEALEVALASCGYDLATARTTLREAGYTEAQVEPSPVPVRAVAPAPPAGALPRPVALPAGSAPVSPPPGLSLLPTNAPLRLSLEEAGAEPAGLSLSEATYRRNQSIFEQERAHARRLEQAYRRCFELATEAHARGDHTAASELSMRGREYRSQFFEEQSKASRRISKRVNASNGLPRINVDLHGQMVADALATVDNGIRNLPESIPGGVVVRYITGRGAHSEGGTARIKPEVVRLLSERGIPFVEAPNGGGWVEATLVPAP